MFETFVEILKISNKSHKSVNISLSLSLENTVNIKHDIKSQNRYDSDETQPTNPRAYTLARARAPPGRA